MEFFKFHASYKLIGSHNFSIIKEDVRVGFIRFGEDIVIKWFQDEYHIPDVVLNKIQNNGDFSNTTFSVMIEKGEILLKSW